MDIIISDTATPELNKLIDGMRNKRPMMYAAGKAAEKAMKAYYAKLPNNRKGFPSRGFWVTEGVKKTQLVSYDEHAATIVVDSVAMAHRFYGGTVYPKRAKALAIPITAEAYQAASPIRFPRPLTLVVRKNRPPLLIETGIIGQSTAWTIHYVLLKSVTHKADKRAMPPDDTIKPAVLAAIESKIALLLSAGART